MAAHGPRAMGQPRGPWQKENDGTQNSARSFLRRAADGRRRTRHPRQHRSFSARLVHASARAPAVVTTDGSCYESYHCHCCWLCGTLGACMRAPSVWRDMSRHCHLALALSTNTSSAPQLCRDIHLHQGDIGCFPLPDCGCGDSAADLRFHGPHWHGTHQLHYNGAAEP